jgi:murein DD-endopeptidase MepM/ murein hydrolase activator NlpD
MGTTARARSESVHGVDPMTLPSLTCNRTSRAARDCIAVVPHAGVHAARHADVSHEERPAVEVAFAPPAFRQDDDEGAAAAAQPSLLVLHLRDDCTAAAGGAAPIPCRRAGRPSRRPERPVGERAATSPASARSHTTRTPETPARTEITHRVRRGETISSVLTTAGVPLAEVDTWLRATRRIYNLNRISVGQALTLTVDPASGRLERLGLEIDADTRLVATRDALGGVEAREEAIPYTRRLRLVTTPVTRNLYATAAAVGIPDKVISDVAEILGWELDLASEIQPDATLRIVYQELVRPDGTQTRPGRVLAVELGNRGTTYGGYYHAGSSDAGYYDRRGEALGRAFLRYPVKFSRVTSGFSRTRFHPILKRRTPHHGVDFAAPPGTPVAAVADGRVTRAGWHGGYGRYVRIRHDGVYGSGYAHLSRIPAEIRPGAVVQKGQVIGYVGSTGQATGPHLHFEMYRHDRYIDPLNTELPRGRALEGESLAAFRLAVAMVDGAYAEIESRYAAPEDAEPAVTQVAQING